MSGKVLVDGFKSEEQINLATLPRVPPSKSRFYSLIVYVVLGSTMSHNFRSALPCSSSLTGMMSVFISVVIVFNVPP